MPTSESRVCCADVVPASRRGTASAGKSSHGVRVTMIAAEANTQQMTLRKICVMFRPDVSGTIHCLETDGECNCEELAEAAQLFNGQPVANRMGIWTWRP